MTPVGDTISFGTLLKAFRKHRHLTQQALAVTLGIHHRTLARWEQGDHLPESKALVLELARCLKLNDQETRRLLEASLTALSPYWSVPLPRNPFFTGREEILEMMHAQLRSEQAVALTQSSALHGLGGVGKTQIALEYAYRHALEYSAIFWIGAETEEGIASSLLHIAEVLQLPGWEGKDQPHVVAAVRHWLSTHRHWLLIWDNLEELELLDRFLPPARPGALLITTRCRAFGTLAQGLDLLPMEQEEGILFLLRRAKVLALDEASEQVHQPAASMLAHSSAALELVKAVGGLPLALDQAGAYLETTQCGLPAYLDLFHTHCAALLSLRGERVRDHPASVTTTFTLALRAIAEHHPATLDLLHVCSLLQPDAIPEELFRQGAEHLGTTLGAACRDAHEWNQVAASACAYSLLRRQPQEYTFSMHRLVQAVLKNTLPETIQCTWKRRVLGAISQLFPSDEKEQADYWQRCERLLPHALLCLTWKEEEILRITLMNHVATYFLGRARAAEAEELYLRAMRLGEQTLGAEHPQVGEILYGLAKLSVNQGKHAEAEAFYLRAMRLGEQTLGAEHPQVAAVLQGLAMLYGNLGRYPEAEHLYQRALRLHEQALGAEHPQVATSLQGLAVLYDDLGKYREAEALYQRALRIREQALGAEHPQVATVLHNLAECYREQGRYAEAEPLFQQALSIWEQAFDSDHPRIGYPLHNLAEIYREQGRYIEAEPLLQRALRIWEQQFGPEHRHVAVPLNGLANLFREQGKDAEAEPLFRRALFIRKAQLGPHHPETAETLHDLALLRKTQGNLGEALSLAERALQIRVQSLGEAHPKTMATRTLYNQLLWEQTSADLTVASLRYPETIPDPCEDDRHENGASSSLHQAASPSSSKDDPLQEFLEACCERHPRAWCRSADLWQAYKQWVVEHQERFPLTRRAFATHLKAQGCRADHTHEARIWRGITVGKQER